MPKQTSFNRRFRELVKGFSDTELGVVLGVTADTARKMRQGDIRSLKLQAALRLARNLNVSPWYLGGEEEPNTPTRALPPKKAVHISGKQATAECQSPAADHLLFLQEEMAELRARIRRIEDAVRK